MSQKFIELLYIIKKDESWKYIRYGRGMTHYVQEKSIKNTTVT